MKHEEYIKHDALGLAELVAGGQVTSSELVEAAIARTEAVNPKINAVVTKMYDIARRDAAQKKEGPFAGVPFLLKDLLGDYAGVPTTRASRSTKSETPHKDNEIVARYKRAGLIVAGKTNTPEFGLMGVTEPELFGPCRNPWNTAHTPGGSSGGSASAVAAGIVPMASGGDGGGSIRIPAACCGLFGLKPSRGRAPNGPARGQFWQGAAVQHVISRSVRDSAAALDAICAPDKGAPFIIQSPAGPYMEEIKHAPRPLKIAINTASPIGKSVDPEVAAAVDSAAKLLRELGHTVDAAAPKINGQELAVSYVTMVCGEVAADVREVEAAHGGSSAVRDKLELGTRTLALMGRTFSSCDFVSALRVWERAGRAMAAFFEEYDIYVTPTLARPPVRIGELAFKPAERVMSSFFNAVNAGKLLKAAGLIEKVATENLAAMPFTQLANVTGLPAMSVPLATAGGLPCGVQFNAPFGDEATLLRLAAQLEKAAPWFDRLPEL